jgi:transcriptional regulator with XRE-family HTH domain
MTGKRKKKRSTLSQKAGVGEEPRRKKHGHAAEKPKQQYAELPPSLDIKKIGRPSKYDPTFCDLALEMGAKGFSRAQIAANLGVSRQTMATWEQLHPQFLDDLKEAKDLALAWWETAGQTNMTRQGFNATAFIFQMKNRFREDYRDVNVNEHTGTIQTAFADEAARKEHQAHVEMLGKRFGDMADRIAEAEAAKKVDHMAGLNARFGGKPNGKANGSAPASSLAENAALNEASAKWLRENGRRDH